MDIGLIVLVIIASLVGNILKQQKRQGERGRSGGSKRSMPNWPPFSPYGSPGSDLPPIGRGIKKDTRQRPVIRHTPVQSTPAFSIESDGLENTSSEGIEAMVNEVHTHDIERKTVYENSSLDLDFNEQDLIKGIIMAEVISPPKCRR